MCKGPHEKGGPYRCPGDMSKAVGAAERSLDKATAAQQDAGEKVERAQIALEALQEGGPEVDMQERMQERADECDGTYDDANSIAQEIAAKGHLCAVEETSTYDPDNDHDGERQYDDQSYEVKVFGSEEELDEYMEGRYSTEGGDGDTAYGVDDRTVDYSTGEMESSSLFIHRAEGEPQIDQDLVKSHGRQVARAGADLKKAEAAKSSADMKVVGAKHQLQQAKRDYEATPRGMGQLQRDIDSCERSGDVQTAAFLRGRLHDAEVRVNEEERQRKANADERGDQRPTYYFAAMKSGEQATPNDNLMSVDKDRAARLSQEDGISGTSRYRDLATDSNNWSHYPHEVTLTRTDKDSVHEVTLPFKMGSPHAGETPSVSEVLHSYSADAASYDNAGGDFDTWREDYGVPDKEDDPDTYRAARKEFTEGKKTLDRLERFLGPDRFEQYKFGESGEYGG